MLIYVFIRKMYRNKILKIQFCLTQFDFGGKNEYEDCQKNVRMQYGFSISTDKYK